MTSITVTGLRAANIARDREWNTGSERLSLSFRGNELAGEVGEACNIIKKLDRERIGLVGSRATKEHLAEELADVVICADLIAMDAGVELDAAIIRKFNATSAKNGLLTRMSTSPSPTVDLDKARNAEFSRGYVIACCNLINMHGTNTYSIDTFTQIGITQDEIAEMDLSEYDLEALAVLEDMYGLEKMYPGSPVLAHEREADK